MVFVSAFIKRSNWAAGAEEFYSITFRKKVYNSLEELQKDLDEWLVEYNQQRTHSGRYCFGKTPIKYLWILCL